MIQPILIGIALLASFFGLLRTPTPIWDERPLSFGAISWPTSLDVFTNPTGTDSVSTVSHSGQHSNANDALEALEAKLGIGASTPVADTIFGGNGTGISGWFTWATSTRMTATNFLATGSTTLQRFTATHSTTTQATTTNSFATTASSTNLYSTFFTGAGLSVSCESTNALTWSGGTFGCLGISTSGPTTFSTTTSVAMSTTTLSIAAGSLPNTTTWEITFVTASTTGASSLTDPTTLIFNSDHTATYSQQQDTGGVTGNTLNGDHIVLQTPEEGKPQQYFKIKIVNNSGFTKFGSYDAWKVGTTTAAHSTGPTRLGMFLWANTDAITQIDIGVGSQAQFLAGTKIQVMGY